MDAAAGIMQQNDERVAAAGARGARQAAAPMWMPMPVGGVFGSDPAGGGGRGGRAGGGLRCSIM